FWLATFVVLGGFYLCPFMLGYAGWYSGGTYRTFMFFVPFQQLFLIGPVLFFYVKALLDKDFQLSRTDLIHFLPAALYLLYSLVVFVGDVFLFEEYYFYADGRDKDLAFWYQMAGLVSMLFYLLLSLRYYWNYRKISVQEVSFADAIAFNWIQHFAIAFSLILLLRVLFFILNPEWGQFGSKYWYYLCFSVLLQYISISGYNNTVRATIKMPADSLVDWEPVEEMETPPSPLEGDQDILSNWKPKINDLFEAEKLHQNPSLTLTDLATLLNTNRSIVSKAINQEFQMNFNDFVNEKRAAAVIQKLRAGEHAQNTLLGIALDCGFNSKTTFNRAFKKHTMLTPQQFINQNKL
ncbi:MAG: helix-turn-helix domain-containing protein, partial [Bacteroidota bacterium]